MLYNQNDMYIGRSLDLYGEYSEAEVDLFTRIVSHDDTVVDIGANIGCHTIVFGRIAKYVVAVEPQRLPYYYLCANVALAELVNVLCLNNAVGSAPGVIAVPELDPDVWSNFGGLDLTEPWQEMTLDVRMVPVICIDDLHLPDCSFIKIDVEGMELDVLRGAANTIQQHQPILYLENDRLDKQAKLLAHVKSLGYEIWEHRPSLYNPSNYFGNRMNVFGEIVSVNIFCRPKDKETQINPRDFGLRAVERMGT